MGIVFQVSNSGKTGHKPQPPNPPVNPRYNYDDFEYGPMINVKLPPYNAVGNGIADDRAAIQNAINDATMGGTSGRVFFPNGLYGVGDEVFMNQEVHLIGEGEGSIIKALPGFNFNASPNHEKAVLHQKASNGLPSNYDLGKNQGRSYIRDLQVNGNNNTNSQGILACIQQPSIYENVRIQNCAFTGLTFVASQQVVVRNLMCIGCGTGVYLRGAEFCWFYDLDIEQHTVSAVKMDFGDDTSGGGGLPAACQSNNFHNVHLECDALTGACDKQFDVVKAGIFSVDGLFISWGSNPPGVTAFTTLFKLSDITGDFEFRAPIYTLRNIAVSGNPDKVTILDDATRSISLNAFDNVRNFIPFLVASNENFATPDWPGNNLIIVPTLTGLKRTNVS